MSFLKEESARSLHSARMCVYNFWQKDINGTGFYPISQMFSLSLVCFEFIPSFLYVRFAVIVFHFGLEMFSFIFLPPSMQRIFFDIYMLFQMCLLSKQKYGNKPFLRHLIDLCFPYSSGIKCDIGVHKTLFRTCDSFWLTPHHPQFKQCLKMKKNIEMVKSKISKPLSGGKKSLINWFSI